MRDAVGGPVEVEAKLVRFGRTLRLGFDRDEMERRFRRMEQCGFMKERPTRLQLLVGGFDMLRLLLSPAARDYYSSLGISFSFHQLLRVLDDPVSMIDPTGLFSERDTIVGHLLQVVHFNPVFDLQLIQIFPDGLENLEAQVAAMVAGTHPRQRTIGAIVEDPTYPLRLLEYVQRYRRDPATTPPLRPEQDLARSVKFAAAEQSFSTLPAFLSYCSALPRGRVALLSHLRRAELHAPACDRR
jgi:hypothetical protein